MPQNPQASHWAGHINWVQQSWAAADFFSLFPMDGKQKDEQYLHPCHLCKSHITQRCKLPFSLIRFPGWELKPFRAHLLPPQLTHKHRWAPWFLIQGLTCCTDFGPVPASNATLPEQHFEPTSQLLGADINEDSRWEMGQVGNVQRHFSLIVWYFQSSHKQAALVSFPRKTYPTRGCYIVQ